MAKLSRVMVHGKEFVLQERGCEVCKKKFRVTKKSKQKFCSESCHSRVDLKRARIAFWKGEYLSSGDYNNYD